MNFYTRVAKAIRHYQDLGYQWVDTSWIVGKEALSVTFPGESGKCKLGYLVGSAEQGFIELMQQNRLTAGKYVSAGPCFRFDDVGKSGYHPYFFKVELCCVGSMDYRQLLKDARSFLGGYVVLTAEGEDLYIAGIEIGSYGWREHGNLVWAYGTGLAEPRYTEANYELIRQTTPLGTACLG